ncbi:Glycosyltransferase involved in cell wall bisynthesis [Pseudomonas cuatrocienegasensis]|uniref:Glycosyltransferase involved in cell wall bisynthesis n=1 Tax=Pseudomonas cuatrocienegasensis TaxID=543360 RepID=A0ABY1BG63_9PSED|nr:MULTISPECIES: glycosyltransferase [Pseudomonas]OEC35838.1 glycosyltransferase [Pseudomonas sp. 21C1]SEQ77238.1 Glycosyltransferase involved in cell wall bisynthesis [Pseudomonas cuatrocienegasensis]
MRQVLIIGYVWPEPCSSAAGSRMVELIELFRRQGWPVTFASAAALSEHRLDLASLDVPEVSIRLNCDSFDGFVAALQPDLVLFDRYFTEEQFAWRVERVCPEALRVLDTSDLHSLRDARQRSLKARQQICANERERQQVGAVLDDQATLYTQMAGSDVAQREIAAIYRSDLTLMISDYEMQMLQGPFAVPPALLHHCPLMLIPPRQQPLPFAQRAHFVSIGNFRHAPNWDSVLWLRHGLWPLIRQRLPRAELHVYGAYPPPKATALHAPALGFQVRGWASDAHEVMGAARVCLAPLRFGAGIKGKLADAMACGTPSVTTTIGSEGMAGALPWPGAVVADAHAFADAAVSLHEQPDAWARAQQAGYAILQTRFDREAHGMELVQRLLRLASEREGQRQANFVGAMLRHHAHKSTQYMSQWIAEKNRRTDS